MTAQMRTFLSLLHRRVLFVALFLAASSGSAQAQRLDIEFVATPKETVERMLEVAEVGSRDYVIDLGSGDGRIVIAAAGRGARGLGVDLDPARIREAQANARGSGVGDRVAFRQENLFSTGLGEATVLTLYLHPELNLKLRPRLLALRPGTRIVSHRFDMGEWKPDLSDHVAGPVYLWIVPARVEGRWQLRSGGQALEITLKQRFQELQGTARVDGRTVPLRDARLRGGAIEFTVDIGGTPTRFRGLVDGRRMQGSEPGAGWQATRS
jgi:SAM-dependent methyltransferase